MDTEKNYLDNLLNTVLEPETEELVKEAQLDEKLETSEEKTIIIEEPVATKKDAEIEEPIAFDKLEIDEAAPVLSEEFSADTPNLEAFSQEMLDLDFADLELSDIVMQGEELGSIDVQNTAEKEPADIASVEKLPKEELEITDVLDAEESPKIEELGMVDVLGAEKELEIVDALNREEPLLKEEPLDTGEELSLEDIKMPESDDELKLEDIEIPEISADELNIDGLDKAIQSETELQMAGELNVDELELGNFGMGDEDLGVDIPDLALLNDSEEENDTSISMDDNLEDVLNMLDDDAELAEINDMLKKSDNNEPIQDDMMDLLHQMADDEAASVNAGLNHMDDEDDGVPIPEIPKSVPETKPDENIKKSDKKAVSKKKKKDDVAGEGEETEKVKKPGKLSKFFHFLTDEYVPEPTEEELAAEKEAKAAKKQELQTKKEEEKVAKEEAKKAKAEEKAVADKAKQEAAAQKQKAKQAKKAAKKAKKAAEGSKKRVPPKKVAAAAALGISVGGAVILSSNILSAQGFLQTARNAYYDGDYQTVYMATYGMEIDEAKDDGLIKARSEVIFKIQRRYDSYQNYIKIGREVEALDALLRGITAYDNVNADAQKYEVVSEVDAVMANILSTLEKNYGLDETEARAIIANQDAVSYTMALNDIIAAK